MDRRTIGRRTPAPAPSIDDGDDAPAGLIGPQRTLPGSRAVVGGLLVTLAAIALFASYTGATTPPRQSYLVAARNLRPGQVIGDADVRPASMDLPAPTASRAYRSVDEVLGRTAVGPITAGELVDRSTLPDRSPKGARAQLSLALEPDRTVDGSLLPGDLVDVLVTYGSGGSSTTEVVASRVRLIAVPPVGDAQLGASKGQTITVEVGALDEALRLVNATRAGEVTLVRTTGFEGHDYTSSTYSPAPGTPSASIPSTAPRAAG